jgi:chromosome segregation ATPase
VRGMKSRIAEIEEAKETAEARLLLREHELIETQEKALSLERHLEEMKEQFEIELTRTTLAPTNDKTEDLTKENTVLRETADELLRRSTDTERLLDEARDNTAAIQAVADDLKEENAALRVSLEEHQRAQAELKSQIAEKEQAFEGERHKSNQVIAEKYQSESKIIDLSNELEGARLKVQLLQDALDGAVDEKSSLSNELRTFRAEFDSRISFSDERIVQLTDALRESRRTLQKLFEITTNKNLDGSQFSGTQDLDMEDGDTSSNER